VAKATTKQGSLVQAANFATQRAGRSFDANLTQARKTSGLLGQTGVGIERRVVGRAEQDGDLRPGIGYQAPSVLILMVFITSMAGAAAVIESRRLGVTRRMLGTPTSSRTVLGGLALSRFALAAFQAVFILFVGTFFFRVKWGQPLGAALVILLFVGVATSVAMLIGASLRTPEQAASIGPPVGIAMGMLGGCMWPLEIVPKPMQTLGHLFPHAWAMDAWIKLIGRGSSVGDILPQLGVLAAFVAALLPLAAWRLRRSVLHG
jgi:ABC-2 type transport system permease protein